MISRILNVVLVVILIAGCTLAYSQELISEDQERPVRMRAASPYWVYDQAFKVKRNTVLPLVIVIRNNSKPRSICIKIKALIEPSCPPSYCGFEVQGQNPSASVKLNPYQCKKIYFNMKINVDNRQLIAADVFEGDGNLLDELMLEVNDKSFSELDFYPYDESKLCDFSMPPGCLSADRPPPKRIKIKK